VLDLYVPASDEPVPVVVWVHGGGWMGGDKEPTPAFDLTHDGYAVATVQYRLSSEARFPAQFHDVQAAIRWLRANAGTYGLDDAHVGAWGASAGGHLVALLGMAADEDELEGAVADSQEHSSSVQAVVDWYGPTDFLHMDAEALPNSAFQHDAASSPESLLLGCAIQSCPDRAERASPISYVSAHSAPFLIVHGDQDRVVPPRQSQALAAALRDAGDDVTLHMVLGAGHGVGLPDDAPLVAEAKAFFDRSLK
jgi:acetyl esterase/lipase